MKVKELVEYLQTLDQERDIYAIYDCYVRVELDDFSEAGEAEAEDYGINVGDYLTYIG